MQVAGVNDPATIDGDDAGTVTEDHPAQALGNVTATGQLTISDLDGSAQEAFQVVTSDNPLQGTPGYGSLTIDASGSWTYTLDDDFAITGADEGTDPTITDTIQVQSVDGTTHDIVITINEDGIDSGEEGQGATPLPLSSALTHTSTINQSDYLVGVEAPMSIIQLSINWDRYTDLQYDTNASWYEDPPNAGGMNIRWTLQLSDDPSSAVTFGKYMDGGENASVLSPSSFVTRLGDNTWDDAEALGYAMGTGFDPNTGVSYLYFRRTCLLYTSPSPRDATLSRMPSSA